MSATVEQHVLRVYYDYGGVHDYKERDATAAELAGVPAGDAGYELETRWLDFGFPSEDSLGEAADRLLDAGYRLVP